MSLHGRIKEARKNKGITQAELGALIGVAKTTIAGYEKNSEPTAAQLGEIADVLDVDITFLLQDEIKRRHDLQATIHEMEHLIKKYRLLDHEWQEAVDSVLDIGYRQYEKRLEEERDAAILREQREQTEAAEEIEPKTVFFLVPGFVSAASAGLGQPAENEYAENFKLTREPPYGTSYIIRVSGDSMEPTYHHGERVFVHAQHEIPVGKIGIFFMDGQQWIKELGNGVLLSHNQDPEYAPRPMTDDVVCQGLVLGVCDDSYFE